MFFAKTFILLSFTAAMTAAAARTHGLMLVTAMVLGVPFVIVQAKVILPLPLVDDLGRQAFSLSRWQGQCKSFGLGLRRACMDGSITHQGRHWQQHLLKYIFGLY